jgi:transposase
MTVDRAETAVHLYGRGMTITEMVARVGYSAGTIRKVPRKHGVMT